MAAVFVVIEDEPGHAVPFVVLAVCSTQERADAVIDARKVAYSSLMHVPQPIVDAMIRDKALAWTVEELDIDGPCRWIDPGEASDV